MRLRIALVVTFLLALTAMPAAAQVGITGGGIYSNAAVELDGSSVETNDRTGFQFGVSYATGGIFGVIVGGYYSEKGFEVASTLERARLSYIEVPVMGVVRLPILERVIGPRLYGGVNGGFEVSCSTEGTGLVTAGLCENTNSFDFGLKGGIGLQVLFFGLDFAYTYGLTDVAKEESLKINNRAWSLALIIGVG
ncbi:MAG: PorT family protein [marine benthic group bacterium]|nr:PorT family protein [Gemmatimonadota bacterium]